jgi:hypothetical protein
VGNGASPFRVSAASLLIRSTEIQLQPLFSSLRFYGYPNTDLSISFRKSMRISNNFCSLAMKVYFYFQFEIICVIFTEVMHLKGHIRSMLMCLGKQIVLTVDRNLVLLMRFSPSSCYFHFSPQHPVLKKNLNLCIQKFPDWPLGSRTANGTALCHKVQLYRYFVSQCR